MHIRLVDNTGRNFFILEAHICLKALINPLLAYLGRIYRAKKFRHEKSGRFVYKDGTFRKIGNARIGDSWFKKWRIDGDKDTVAAYKSLEKRGKLGEVNDREVWGPLLKGAK